MSMRALPLLAALLLGAATALLVSCGGNDGRIPSHNASSLERALQDVQSDFDAGRCDAAQQAVSRLNGALVNLPDSVDARLRSRLRSGITNLDQRVTATCGQAQQQTQTPQQTQTQQQTQAEKTQTETTQTDTTETDKTETDTTPTETGTNGTGTGTGTTDTGTAGTGTTTDGNDTGGAPSGGGNGG
jgi:hypothetical protein